MEQRWRSLGQALSRRTGVVLAVAAIITVVLGAGLTRLEFATGQDSYINAGSRVSVDNEAYQDRFGGENMVVLYTMEDGLTVADLFTPANLEAFAQVEEQLRSSETITAVVSPLTALEFTANLVDSGIATEILSDAIEREPDPAGVDARNESLLVTATRAALAGERTFENPAWVRFLLFENIGFELNDDGTLTEPPDDELVIRQSLRGFIPDTTHALLGAVLVGNADLDELAAGNDAVFDAIESVEFDNARVTITGTPTFLTDINDYLQGGMLTLGGLALVVMAVVLLVAFHVRWRFLPLAMVIVGVIWAFGLVGYVGLDLSLVTISGLPILIGIGIDFAIQMHNRIEEEVAIDHDEGPFAETSQRLGPWLVVATIAAAGAFLTMLVSRVPMIRDFGVLLALGIVALVIAGYVLPLAVLGLRERRSPTREASLSPRIEAVVAWFGSAPSWVVAPFIALAIIVPVLGVLLEDQVEIESDPINWANQDTDTIRNARLLEDETGFATTLGIYITVDGEDENGIFTDELAAFVHDFTLGELEVEPTLAAGSSLATTLSYLLAVPGATSLPPTGLDMLKAYEQAPPDIQRLLVSEDGNAAQISLRVGPSALDERAELLDRLADAIAEPPADRAALPANASATPAGLAVVGVGLLENITANRAVLTYLALAVVGIWLLVRFRRLLRALLALVPVMIAVGTSAVLVAVLGITLSPLTTVSGPLVTATAAEFTILILGRYLEERERGLSPAEATHVASARTGRAFFASALTTAGGFAVLIFSALPLLSDFGVIVTMNVAIALLSALVVMPPLMVWADNRGLVGIDAVADERGAYAVRLCDRPTGPRLVAAVGLGVVLVGSAVAVGATADSEEGERISGEYVAVALPTTTTTTTEPPAEAAGPVDVSTFGNERPGGLIDGTLWDLLTGVGASDQQA
ncbi:MAG TPA: MMPL family transporter, partial [Acidimicrobiales bacterium]|nr:MMPL family transporter [Acidimicrobiales bacterium]